MRILVTGAAGFIGYHLSRKLLDGGKEVIGLDNLDPYYSVHLKEMRLDRLKDYPNFRFHRIDLRNSVDLARLFQSEGPEVVVNLAAQAGVRHSLENPQSYVSSNLVGFANILEECRRGEVEHLIYASSSSVYGANTQMPFSPTQSSDHPLSLYGATKKADELMAHSYSHLFDLPSTGLRYFTVYGPWGRPDMALFIFTEAIQAGKPISLFNHGRMRRGFTFIDDAIDATIRVLSSPPRGNTEWNSDNPDLATSSAPYRIYNIGSGSPVELSNLVDVLEKCLGRKAERRLEPIQPGDVPAAYADMAGFEADFGCITPTPIEVGVERFVEWYREVFPG